MSNSRVRRCSDGSEICVRRSSPSGLVDVNTGRPMFRLSRVMEESNLLNDLTELLESFHDMNPNVKIYRFLCLVLVGFRFSSGRVPLQTLPGFTFQNTGVPIQ